MPLLQWIALRLLHKLIICRGRRTGLSHIGSKMWCSVGVAEQEFQCIGSQGDEMMFFGGRHVADLQSSNCLRLVSINRHTPDGMKKG